MDYEKEYKNALERAKNFHSHMVSDGIRYTVEEIFPELKMNEDELTWLTKYIEEEVYSLSIDIRDDEDRIKLKKLQKALAWLEKQKPVEWSEEDRKLLDEVREHIVGVMGDKPDFTPNKIYEGFLELINKLKFAKPQPNQEWSEEDERIRKALLDACNLSYSDLWEKRGVKKESIIAWLEKQGEQKPADNVEPKFKVGDWITDGEAVFHITSYSIDYGYQLETPKGTSFHFSNENVENKYHLWTIQDAEDGDVLAGGDWVFIFRKFHINGFPKCHCHYDLTLEEFKVDTDSYMACGGDIYPATKKQCYLLFQKMKEAGYEWDEEKKELRNLKKF